MQRILTAREMREADRRTIEESGVAGLILMENAASRVVEALIERFGPLESQRLLIVCGKGANGGDGLAVARQLLVRRLVSDLEVVLCADAESLSGDPAVQWRMLQAQEFEPRVAEDIEQWRALRERTLRATIVVDALLGTGLSGPARGFLADVIDDLTENHAHSRFLAIDMPSGLPSDDADADGPVAPAECTVTFTAPKVSQVFPPNSERVGDLRVGRIGTSEKLLQELPGDPLLLFEGADCRPFLAPRKNTSHKGSFGHVLAVGGSRAKPGAILMTATAAARMGAGLTTVLTARGAAPAIAARTPELMTEPAEELEDGSMGATAWRPDRFERATVVAVGPGLGTDGDNQQLVRRIVAQVSKPLVVDADGLTALAKGQDEVWRTPSPALVLTPHPGEMARLTGLETGEVLARRVETARDFSRRRNAYVVLKGYRTVTACPDGRVYVNPTGTPAMATGGSGDILTGMIAGLLAQFPDEDPGRVVAAAVWLHGCAGQIAAQHRTEQTTLAMDLLDALPGAIREARGGGE